MSDTATGPWLQSAFVSAMKGIDAQASEQSLTEEALRLIEEWSSPQRIFHNIDHVKRLLNRVDDVENWTHNPDILRVAAWYHLAVFSLPRTTITECRDDNAEASAAQAHRQLQAFGVSKDTADHVASLILSLRSTVAAPDDNDTVTFVDVDLSYLASIPQDYKKYIGQLRQECASIPDEHYLQQRRAHIKRLLDRNDIFLSPLSDDLETPARQNLEGELYRIEQELNIDDPSLEKMDTSQPSDSMRETEAHSDSDDDTGTLIIRAKSKGPKTGSTSVVTTPTHSSEALTPVMGIPTKESQDSDNDNEDSFASTLESAVDCFDLLDEKVERG
ncbi:MAG: hypothetical protein Q4P66_05105 [Actinomycetaceae bacterium]|nr:hypothetical protein [Actinomycetaceae bacterium]MDO5747020.1 hypothetical protein [Actinomycetaceae bacterium]